MLLLLFFNLYLQQSRGKALRRHGLERVVLLECLSILNDDG